MYTPTQDEGIKSGIHLCTATVTTHVAPREMCIRWCVHGVSHLPHPLTFGEGVFVAEYLSGIQHRHLELRAVSNKTLNEDLPHQFSDSILSQSPGLRACVRGEGVGGTLNYYQFHLTLENDRVCSTKYTLSLLVYTQTHTHDFTRNGFDGFIPTLITLH